MRTKRFKYDLVDDRLEHETHCYEPEEARDDRGQFEHWRNGVPFISNPQELWEDNPLFKELWIKRDSLRIATWSKPFERIFCALETKAKKVKTERCPECINGVRWDENQDRIACWRCNGTGRLGMK